MSATIRNIAGIDYGGKMAGTTVIAHLTEQEIKLWSSVKKKDADAFIMDWAEEKQPDVIFIDAPLSLPAVYRHPDAFDDYFYRKADRELKAMSPLFLGGLTARAMRLKRQLESLHVETLEIYPSQLARHYDLKPLGYKKKKENIPLVLEKITPLLAPFNWAVEEVNSWHHLDALLALISGIRYVKKEHLVFGDPDEGIIIV